MEIGKFIVENKGAAWNIIKKNNRKIVEDPRTGKDRIVDKDVLSHGCLTWCLKDILRIGCKDDINVAKAVLNALEERLGANMSCSDDNMEDYRKKEIIFYNNFQLNRKI